MVVVVVVVVVVVAAATVFFLLLLLLLLFNSSGCPLFLHILLCHVLWLLWVIHPTQADHRHN